MLIDEREVSDHEGVRNRGRTRWREGPGMEGQERHRPDRAEQEGRALERAVAAGKDTGV